MATAILAAPSVPVLHFRNILFATDFSDYSQQALPYAANLAHKFGSNVYLCHVVTPSQLVIGAPEAAPFLYEAQRTRGANELADIARFPEFKGLNTRPLLVSGLFEEEILRVINEHQIDLVVVGTHGRTGIRRLVLGSATEQICRIATCPVLSIGPDVISNEKSALNRILIPTDFSEESTQILPYILDIAREYKAAITFLHVIPLDAAVNINARLLAVNACRTLKMVFGNECGEHKPQFLIEFGQPAEAILRAATETKADLIAMGIRHAFAPGIHLRSGVAYQVMARANCPVLTCR